MHRRLQFEKGSIHPKPLTFLLAWPMQELTTLIQSAVNITHLILKTIIKEKNVFHSHGLTVIFKHLSTYRAIFEVPFIGEVTGLILLISWNHKVVFASWLFSRYQCFPQLFHIFFSVHFYVSNLPRNVWFRHYRRRHVRNKYPYGWEQVCALHITYEVSINICLYK